MKVWKNYSMGWMYDMRTNDPQRYVWQIERDRPTNTDRQSWRRRDRQRDKETEGEGVGVTATLKTSHEHSGKDPNRVRKLSPSMPVNTSHVNSINHPTHADDSKSVSDAKHVEPTTKFIKQKTNT